MVAVEIGRLGNCKSQISFSFNFFLVGRHFSFAREKRIKEEGNGKMEGSSIDRKSARVGGERKKRKQIWREVQGTFTTHYVVQERAPLRQSLPIRLR